MQTTAPAEMASQVETKDLKAMPISESIAAESWLFVCSQRIKRLGGPREAFYSLSPHPEGELGISSYQRI